MYKIYPNVHWLFLVQAVALTIGGFPLYYLALQAKLNHHQAKTIVFAYLLYPLILNKSLFDFYPDVIAVPGFLIAILAARTNKIFLFCVAITIILSSKAVISLTVVSMGLWLALCEHKKLFGAIAIVTGLAWFIISTQSIVPTFLGDAMGGTTGALSRYSYLGNSIIEIATNIFLRPSLVFGKVFSLATLEYIVLLILPIIWGLSPKYLLPLWGAAPMLGMNILSTTAAQRNLVHHYSLPILPFLFLAVISAVANQQNWLKTRRTILIWSIVSFLLLGKIGYLPSYFTNLDTHQAKATAIARIQDSGAVLTTGEIAPHLTHRPIIKLTFNGTESIDLQSFKYILLDQRHPGWNSSVELIKTLKRRTQDSGSFKLEYQQDDIYLFVKK